MKLKFNRLFIILLGATLLSGCNLFPFVFKTSTAQGNLIDQDAVDQLQAGMTKEQVAFLMGSPILDDPFTADRWDYLYILRPGKGKPLRRELQLYFDGDKLAKISGDVENPFKTTEQKKVQDETAGETPEEQR